VGDVTANIAFDIKRVKFFKTADIEYKRCTKYAELQGKLEDGVVELTSAGVNWKHDSKTEII
jgi:hypothetical protein